jgi:hypothetical protein
MAAFFPKLHILLTLVIKGGEFIVPFRIPSNFSIWLFFQEIVVFEIEFFPNR